jgi:D-beta-D-heptose 7-phosphate kinase/D-beta-D-heptose 1-phosphate adenosyltransferase
MKRSALLPALARQRILVVGDLMLDRYWMGDAQRLSPEAPVPVVKVRETRELLGGAGNVALNLASIGVRDIGVLGIVGRDAAGATLRRLFEERGIAAHLVEDESRPTVTKVRIISREQQVTRVDFEEPFAPETAVAVAERFAAVAAQYDAVIFSDYAKGALGEVGRMLAVEGPRLKLVDPKTRDFARYRGADWITPNWGEFLAAGGVEADESAIEESARAILERSGIHQMLLTRGEKGVTVLSREGRADFPADVSKVHDVTGAGDTVIAVFAACLAAEMPPAEAAQLANRAAGIVVGRLGAAQVSAEELRKLYIGQHLSDEAPSVEEDTGELLEAIAAAKRAGERIVFTNGCFDVLHFGHVTLLQACRRLGDRLVVGLNSDASVTRLKGPTRPVNDFAARAGVMLALEAVDWVIPFGAEGDDTPLELIRAVQPDVLVKGGDYTLEQIVGAEDVIASGGEVQIIPLVEGLSTTKLLAKGAGS